MQSDKDLKLSYRLANYARDQGGDRYKRLIQKVGYQLEQKRVEKEGLKPNEVRENHPILDLRGRDQDTELPVVCFKCIYGLILANEGRVSAMRFFTVAKSELEKTNN